MRSQAQQQGYVVDSHARSPRNSEMNHTAALQRDVAELKTQLRDAQEAMARQTEHMFHNVKLQMSHQAEQIQKMNSEALTPDAFSFHLLQQTSHRDLIESQVELEHKLSALQVDVLELQGRRMSPSLPTLRTDQVEAKRTEFSQSSTSMQHGSQASDVILIDIKDRLAKLESSFATLQQLEPNEDAEDQSREMERCEIDGSYAYTVLETVEKEPSKAQLRWTEKWLEEVENGELDVYTCLGLSDCLTWTPDTRQILIKAVAVTLLQMAVPFYLLLHEDPTEMEWGPAQGNFGFRVVGVCLYGYAIYNMYAGADGHCRTSLVNLMFQYDCVHVGYWLPLVVGELANVFTAIVLIVALYSIFTTQTQPADLIMNAIAVNFLCDCDGNFVDNDMKEEALETFKKFTHRLFTTQQARVRDPYVKMGITKISHYSLYLIALGGILGSSLFLLYPSHADGYRDTNPGFGLNVVKFPMMNNTLARAGN